MSSRAAARKRSVRRKRRHAVKGIVLAFCFFVAILASTRMASDYFLKQEPEKKELQATAVHAVERPVIRENSQLSRDLQEFALTNETAAKVCEDYEKYPKELILSFLNNPEMEEFIAGYLNADLTIERGFTDAECSQDFPLLLQWDKRWGYQPYGKSIIGLSGCGPTCLSMVLLSLTHDTEKTPTWVARFSEENGYYVEDSGTAWSLMTQGAAQLGLYSAELSLDEAVMKSALDNGRPIICTVGPGDFTTQGHFIVIYGYDANGFFVNDPNCIARSSQVWSYEKLHGQIKNLWSFQSQA